MAMVERTCIATGQNLPAYKLIRFVIAPNGFAVADLVGRLPGRSAWVAANDAAIRIADQKGHFKRTLGAGLQSLDADIIAIANGLRTRIIATGSMARKSGVLLGGVGKLLAAGHFNGLLAATDASPRELRRLRSKLGAKWVSQTLSSTELGQIFGRESLAFAGLRVSSGPESFKLVQIIYEDIMRLDGFYTAAGCNDLPDRCIT